MGNGLLNDNVFGESLINLYGKLIPLQHLMSFNTPILFLVFNRPESTKTVFNEIRKIKPHYLFIAADGPRAGNKEDDANCKEVKQVFEKIDWECKVTTLYREHNLGCKVAVSSAITWFFDHVEQGIILEDDILPDLSFFSYCEELLNYYKNDDRIMHISGFNVCGTWKENKQSYHASYFGSIWGWASWRRAWKHYDVNIRQWKDPEIQKFVLKKYFPVNMQKDREQLYNDLYDSKINTWDYQWTLCRLINNGFSLIPSRNLIQNIGFNNDATHSTSKPSWLPDKSYSLEIPLMLNNNKLTVDKSYDDKHNEFASGKKMESNSFIKKVIHLIKKK